MIITIQFEIPDKSFELLKKIKEKGAAEFRDSEFDSLEQFKASIQTTLEEEERFKRRNFCDLADLQPLIEHDLIDTNGMSWHLTYIVTDFGKEILEKYK